MEIAFHRSSPFVILFRTSFPTSDWNLTSSEVLPPDSDGPRRRCEATISRTIRVQGFLAPFRCDLADRRGCVPCRGSHVCPQRLPVPNRRDRCRGNGSGEAHGTRNERETGLLPRVLLRNRGRCQRERERSGRPCCLESCSAGRLRCRGVPERRSDPQSGSRDRSCRLGTPALRWTGGGFLHNRRSPHGPGCAPVSYDPEALPRRYSGPGHGGCRGGDQLPQESCDSMARSMAQSRRWLLPRRSAHRSSTPTHRQRRHPADVHAVDHQQPAGQAGHRGHQLGTLRARAHDPAAVGRPRPHARQRH